MFGCAGGLCGKKPAVNMSSFGPKMGAAYAAGNVKTEGVLARIEAAQEQAEAAAAAAAAAAPSASNRAKRVQQMKNEKELKTLYAKVAAGSIPNPFGELPPEGKPVLYQPPPPNASKNAKAATPAARNRSTRRRRRSSRKSRKIESRRARKSNGTR
jgi:pyruvate/2-oxoglutarate dehydrogenase complex dihydrolipoamide acyltransferase (E2) component